MVEKIGAIERELQEAANFKHVTRGAHAQTRQDYLRALVEKINEIPMPAWQALSAAAQEWYNGVITEIQLNPDNPLPDFPEEETQMENTEQTQAATRRPTRRPATTQAAAPSEQPAARPRGRRAVAAEPVQAEAPAQPTARPKARKATAAPSEQPAPARAQRAARPRPATAQATPPAAATADGEPVLKRGAQTYVKQLIIEDPSITTAAVKNKVIEEGYKISALSVSTIVSDFRHSLRVLKDTGHLRGLRV